MHMHWLARFCETSYQATRPILVFGIILNDLAGDYRLSHFTDTDPTQNTSVQRMLGILVFTCQYL